MNKEFFEALRLLEQEKGISAENLLEKITTAVENAVKKDFGDPENVVIKVNPDSQNFDVIIVKTVVEEVVDPANEIIKDEAYKISKRAKVGDTVNVKVKTKDIGRIAAQSAKHILRQGIRDEERLNILKEYQSKIHELINGKVTKIDPVRGSVVIDIGKGEISLPRNEVIPGEDFVPGDVIKVYVVDVRKDKEKTSKPPKVMVSRTHPGLVKRLFEVEVPEIYDGTVEIKAISREAGSRTKIAVYSKDKNIDPVGACIGAKSSRIDAIIDEINGEKIDIVKYSEDPIEFIRASLAPAKHIIEVKLSEVPVVDEVTGEERIQKSCTVTVPDNELSLAIGNKGQNVRLAAKLTGYRIDIHPESGFFGEK